MTLEQQEAVANTRTIGGGVWLSHTRKIGYDEPGEIKPHLNELDALRYVNGSDHLVATFVPYGKTLGDTLAKR